VSSRASRSAAIAIGIGLLLTACGGEGQARPDLAFVSTRDGDYAIYVMNADGAHQKRLTKNEQSFASLSPSALFFQVEPAWSPNGKLLAFASKRGGPSHIYVMEAGGNRTRRLTSTTSDDAHPTWSPDGTHLAFERGTHLYVMSSDGADAHRITNDPAAESDPAWSPKGTWIAYARKGSGMEAKELWLVHPDGSGRHRLTSLNATTESPAWSPDGKLVAFSSDAGTTRFEIFQIRVDGTRFRRLTESGDDAFEPAWAPDGRLIAFSRNGAIVAIDRNGIESTLTDPKNNDSSPAWNPKPPLDEG